MPRRGRAAPPPRTVRPAARAAPPTQVAPVRAAPTAPMAAQAPASQGPGIMGQIAATAAANTIAFTAARQIDRLITGDGGQAAAQAEPQAAVAPAATQQYNQQYNPVQDTTQGSACSFELKQFLNCAQNQADLSLCQGFNEALLQCKQAHGMV